MKLAKHEDGWRTWHKLLNEAGFLSTNPSWSLSPRLPNGKCVPNGTELIVSSGAIEKRNGKYRVKNKKLWAAICAGLRENNE